MRLQSYLARLIGICVIPLLVLTVYLAVGNIREFNERHAGEARSLARIVAENIESLVRSRIRGMQMLAKAPEIDDRSRWSRVYHDAQAFRETYGHNIVIADASGQMLINTYVAYGKPLPRLPTIRGRSAAKQALATLQPANGDLFIGPVSGEPLVAVAVPVVRDAAAAYLIITTMSANSFQRRLDEMPLPEGLSVRLRDSQGDVIAARASSDAGVEERILTAVIPSSGWRVDVGIPAGLFATQLARNAAVGVVLLLLTVAVVAIVGSNYAARRLAQSLRRLGDFHGTPADSDAAPQRIHEIDAIRQRLIEMDQGRSESELRFASIFEQAAVGIALVLPDGRWLRVNAKLCEIVGYSEGELMGMSFQDITHPDDLDSDLSLVQRVLAGELATYSLEKRYRCKDGSVIWILLTVSLVRNPDGSPDYFISVIEDIQARKAAEGQLRLWAESFSNSDVGLAITDPGSQKMIAVNPAFARRRGYVPDEIAGQPIAMLSPAERYPEVRRRVAEIDAAGHGVFETEHLCRDGSRFPVLLDVTVLRSPEGEPFRRIVFALDISERKAAERALQESRERLQQIFLNAVTGIAISELDGAAYAQVNPAFTALLGYTEAELVSIAPMSLLHPEDRDANIAQIRRLVDGEIPFFEIESRFRHKAGHDVWVHKYVSLLHDGEGRPMHRLSLMIDVSGRRAAEESLRRSADELRALALRLQEVREAERTRLSREVHDHLGQMLTGLSLDVGWLEKRVVRVSDEGLRGEMQGKLDEVRGLTGEMIRSVQEIASEMRPSILDNLGLAAALRFEGERFANRSGLSVALEVAEADIDIPPEVVTALFRVCQEALTNIARHARASQVVIRLKRSAEGLRLEIEDDGVGIGNEALYDSDALGLLGMRERILAINGQLLMLPGANGGTLVSVLVA